MRQLSDSHKVFYIDPIKSPSKALKKASKAVAKLEEDGHTVINVIPEWYFEDGDSGWSVTIVAI